MSTQAATAEIVTDQEGMAWRFDARGLSNVEDSEGRGFEWVHDYERHWNEQIDLLFAAGLRPEEEPYRFEDHPDGVVHYYRLELTQ